MLHMSRPPYFDKVEGREPRRRSDERRPREVTKVKCSDCGKECEVPFKPTAGRPVYCNDCLKNHRPPRA